MIKKIMTPPTPTDLSIIHSHLYKLKKKIYISIYTIKTLFIIYKIAISQSLTKIAISQSLTY
jgi:hypothetical protein